MLTTAQEVLKPQQVVNEPIKADLPNNNTKANNEAQTTSKATEGPETNPTGDPKADFSEKFSALSKKEKRIYAAQQEAKALKAQLDKERQELLREKQELEQFRALKGASPLEKLKHLGTDYNELTQWYLNNGQPSAELEVKSVKQELEAFKREQQELLNRQAQEQNLKAEAELNDILNQFKSEINQFVSTAKDDYELINLFDQTSLVYDTIQEYHATNNKVLSIKEASDLVEKYLEEQVQKTTETKKFSKIYKPKAEEANTSKPLGSQSQQPSFKSQPQTKTLSNNITSNAPSFLPAKTEQDRLQRAMAALDRIKK